MLILSKMLFNKKSIQKFFKLIFYGLFKIIYGEIRGKLNPNQEENMKVENIIFEKKISYKAYIIKNSRLYTDTIHDLAIIFKNSIVEGPSFQLRNNINKNCESNIVFEKGTPKIKKNINGTVLSLLTGGGGNSNYWHWLFDVLPRLSIAKKILDLEEIDYFLFPDVRENFQKETLENLKIPLKKTLSSKTNRHIAANKIIVTDHPYNFLNDPDKDSLNIPAWIISFLKEKFLVVQDNVKTNLPKKIFIDRSDSKSGHGNMRKILNEIELKNLLNKKGFSSVILSNYHFNDQIKLFNNAECIIGLHGAGFANTVFCKKNTKVIELQSDTAGEIIKNISATNGLDYDCMSIKPTIETNNQLGHIKVDLDILSRKI